MQYKCHTNRIIVANISKHEYAYFCKNKKFIYICVRTQRIKDTKYE